MRTVLFMVFLSGCSVIRAQSTYEKLFLTGQSFKFSCAELPSKNLFMGLGCAHGITRLDQQGGILQTQCYVPIPMGRFTSFRRVSDNQYAFATSYELGTCDQSGSIVPLRHPAIGLMDTTGTVQRYKYYELNQSCWNVAGDLVVTADNGMVAWGSDTSFFALRVDSSLSPLWSKRYHRRGGFHFIKELPGGDLLAGMNMDTAGAVVARMDNSGSMLWCKSYIRPKGIVHDAFIESDDSFIIIGYTDSTTILFTDPLPPTFQPKLFMMKLDGDGEIQWCRGYDSAPYYWHTPNSTRIEPTLDGNYAVLATLGAPGYNLFYKPFLMKTDVNGDSLWTRAIGRPQYAHYGRDLLAHSDGGYVMTGYMLGDFQGFSSASFVFKGDSLGNFSCWDQPNPVQLVDLFPIDSAFTLSSSVLVSDYPSMFTDTIFPFSVLDGCTFTTGLPSMYSRARPKPTFRPNPNTGRFTMEFHDPLMAESYYGVYDVMGRLLYQRPLPMGKKTEEIDLTRFGAGTYVLKLTDPEGACFERVVVE